MTRTTKILLALAIWIIIGISIWFSSSIVFDLAVTTLRNNHPGISVADFLGLKASTPIERIKFIHSFTFIHQSDCLDSLLLDAHKLDDFTSWEDEEITLNMYDVCNFRSDTIKTRALSVFTEHLSRLPKYSHKSLNADSLSREIGSCLQRSVQIKNDVLENLLRSEWNKQHQSTISTVAKFLNVGYAILFLLFILLRSLGANRLKSLLRFEDMNSD